MELRVLHYFLTVAREENITKAATLLHMTQPTLSRQIHALEEELNVKLLKRYSHYVKLTAEGLLLRRQAQELMDLAENIKQEFVSGMTITGSIRLGCADTRNMSILTGWMTQFHRQYPLITFQLQSKTADVVQEEIENGLLDIGLLMEPVDIMKYEVLRMPLSEKWGILVKKDSQLAQKQKIYPEDLLQMPLLLPERESVRGYLQHWFGKMYGSIHQVATYNLLLNMLCMVKSDLGVAICYDINYLSIPGLSFIPLAKIGMLDAMLVWKKQQAFSRAVRAFIRYCAQVNKRKIK